MAAHSIWTGSISFGLVTIPVSLRSAVEDHDLSFSLLDSHDLAPVGYKHVNKRTRKEVVWKDIVKGYEYKKGKYVVMTPEDFRKANVKASQILEIEDFVDASEVDPIYFEHPYYLVPTEQGARAYALLRAALDKTQKVGVGRLVMHTKQHLVAILPLGDVLLLEVMRFSHEIRGTDKLDLPAPASKSVSERELAAAEQLIGGMTSRFKPGTYKDTYHDDLLRLIEKKRKQGETADIAPYNEPETEAEDTGGKVLDLLPLLKASLRRGRGGDDAESGARKKGARGAKADADADDDEDEASEQTAKAGKAGKAGKSKTEADVTPIEKARAKRNAKAKATVKAKAGKAKKRPARASAKGAKGANRASARKKAQTAAPRRASAR